MESQTSLAQTGKKEIDKFVSNIPVLELFDVMRCLDIEQPYVSLSQNGEIGEFLQKKGISVVHSKADFDYLYESVNSRIIQLRDTDERARTYLQNADYQRQMAELPALMSKLEKIATGSFEELKAPFRAALEYVYDSATKLNGFEMNSENVKIENKKNSSVVYIEIDSRSGTRFYANKKKGDLKLELYSLLNVNYKSDLIFIKAPIFSPEEIIEECKKIFLTPSNVVYYESYGRQINKILSIPVIMTNFLKIRISRLKKSLEIISSASEEKN